MQADRYSCELLTAMVRCADRPDSCALQGLAQQVGNWNVLAVLAKEHRVLPMLYRRLGELGAAVPPATQERLHIEYQRHAAHNLANAAEMIAVLQAFEAEHIQAMPFKGAVLTASVYHDLMARPTGDLDILVHYRDLHRAADVLRSRGYRLKTPVRDDGTPAIEDYYEFQFECEANGMLIELRWRLELIQPRFRRELGLSWIWPHRRTTRLAGAEVPDMSAEIKLLVLCMHGCKHYWSRLIWISDVAQLLCSTPDLDWEQINCEAKKTGLWRAMALGVLLAHQVAGAPVPPAMFDHFTSDRFVPGLARHFQENLFNPSGLTPVGHIPFNLQLLGFQDRMKVILSGEFLRPNERDRAVLPLPKSLHALYYLIRPFRFILDRSAR